MAEYFRLSDRITGHRNKLDNSTTLTLEGEALPQLINIAGLDWTDEQLARIAEAAEGVRQEWHLRGTMEGRRDRLNRRRSARGNPMCSL